MSLVLWVLSSLLLGAALAQERKLTTIFEWKDLEYGFPSESQRNYALTNKLYIPRAGVPIDIDVHYRRPGGNFHDASRQRYFTTIPRFAPGIPYSVATITNNRGPNGPILEAYPNYDYHSSHGSNCNGITSVFRVAIDECNRIWMVDTGRIGANQLCPPQVLVFNLDNDILLFRYQIPNDQYFPGKSLFITPVVDIPHGKCDHAKLYITDVLAPGLIVCDLATRSSWRIENKWMYPDPDFGRFTINEESFNLMDGMFAIAVSPKESRNRRYLFFHALASERENAVPLDIINNRTLWTTPDAHDNEFLSLGKRGVQCASTVVDKHGKLYCGLMEPIGIMAWDTNEKYSRRNLEIYLEDRQRLQFAAGLKLVNNPNSGNQEMWICTNRIQKTYAGTMNFNEINFRILVHELSNRRYPPPHLGYGNRIGVDSNEETVSLNDTRKNLIFT